MKKEDFIKLGISEEDAKKCEQASTEELKAYVTKVSYDELEVIKKKAELDVNERDSQLDTLKKSSGDVVGMKKQIEDLQADNEKNAADHKAEIHNMKVTTAIDTALSNAKAINIKAVKPFLNGMDKAEFDDAGKLKGLSEQLEALAKSEDTKFLFNKVTKAQIKGALLGQSGNEDPDSQVDTSKMTYSELAAHMADNPDAKIN